MRLRGPHPSCFKREQPPFPSLGPPRVSKKLLGIHIGKVQHADGPPGCRHQGIVRNVAAMGDDRDRLMLLNYRAHISFYPRRPEHSKTEGRTPQPAQNRRPPGPGFDNVLDVQAGAIGTELLDLGHILWRVDESTDMNVEALTQMPHEVEGGNLFPLIRGKRQPLAQEQHCRPVIHAASKRLVPRVVSSRLLLCARSDTVNGYHCDKRSGEAIRLR